MLPSAPPASSDGLRGLGAAVGLSWGFAAPRTPPVLGVPAGCRALASAGRGWCGSRYRCKTRAEVCGVGWPAPSPPSRAGHGRAVAGLGLAGLAELCLALWKREFLALELTEQIRECDQSVNLKAL